MSVDTFTYEYAVSDGFSGTAYDYLRKEQDYSTRLLRALIKTGVLLVNGTQARFRSNVSGGEALTVRFGEEIAEFESWDTPISVIFEDSDLIVLDKPVGLIVHPTKGVPDHTLANAVYAHFAKTGFRGMVRFVNRIDRDTTGLVLGAKNRYAHAYCQDQFSAGLTQKTYYTLVQGRIGEKEGRIDAPIARVDGPARQVVEGAKNSLTFFETLGECDQASFLKVRIATGRTHQIRVHMAHVGHPVLSDTLYGTVSDIIARQALHAASLSLIHPRTKERVLFQSPMPQDFLEALDLLGLPRP